MNNKNVLEEVTKAIQALQQYSHNPECPNYTECPTDHDSCRGKLGLDTAMAWELARELTFLYKHLVANFDTKVFSKQRWGALARVERIATIADIFDSVLSHHPFVPLRRQLTKTLNVLSMVVEVLNEHK